MFSLSLPLTEAEAFGHGGERVSVWVCYHEHIPLLPGVNRNTSAAAARPRRTPSKGRRGGVGGGWGGGRYQYWRTRELGFGEPFTGGGSVGIER